MPTFWIAFDTYLVSGYLLAKWHSRSTHHLTTFSLLLWLVWYHAAFGFKKMYYTYYKKQNIFKTVMELYLIRFLSVHRWPHQLTESACLEMRLIKHRLKNTPIAWCIIFKLCSFPCYVSSIKYSQQPSACICLRVCVWQHPQRIHLNISVHISADITGANFINLSWLLIYPYTDFWIDQSVTVNYFVLFAAAALLKSAY